LIANDQVESIFEFARDKFIISLYPTDMLVTHYWKAVKLIQNNHVGNIDKHCIVPLPQFDEVKFPFLVCTGRANISLINLKEFKM